MKNLPIRIFTIAVMFSLAIVAFMYGKNISNNTSYYSKPDLSKYKVTAKVIDYSQNILKAKVLFKTDEFNIDGQ